MGGRIGPSAIDPEIGITGEDGTNEEIGLMYRISRYTGRLVYRGKLL